MGVVALVVSVGMRPRAPGRGEDRRGRGGGTVMACSLLAGPAALFTPMDTAGAMYSRDSVWKLLRTLDLGLPPTKIAIGVLGLVVVVVIARTARHRAETAVPAALTTLTAGAAYALPGYVAWSLPTAALDHDSRVSRIVAAQGVVLVAAYEVFRHPFGGAVGDALMQVTLVGGPLIMLGLIVAIVHAGRRRPGLHPPPAAMPSSSLHPA